MKKQGHVGTLESVFQTGLQKFPSAVLIADGSIVAQNLAHPLDLNLFLQSYHQNLKYLPMKEFEIYGWIEFEKDKFELPHLLFIVRLFSQENIDLDLMVTKPLMTESYFSQTDIQKTPPLLFANQVHLDLDLLEKIQSTPGIPNDFFIHAKDLILRLQHHIQVFSKTRFFFEDLTAKNPVHQYRQDQLTRWDQMMASFDHLVPFESTCHWTSTQSLTVQTHLNQNQLVVNIKPKQISIHEDIFSATMTHILHQIFKNRLPIHLVWKERIHLLTKELKQTPSIFKNETYFGFGVWLFSFLDQHFHHFFQFERKAESALAPCFLEFQFQNSLIFTDALTGGLGAWKKNPGNWSPLPWKFPWQVPSLELQEELYPIRIENHELRTNIPSNGLYEGGPGCLRTYRILEPCELQWELSYFDIRPKGCDGGQDGSLSELWIQALDSSSRYKVTSRSGKIQVPAQSLIILGTARGGAYGQFPTKSR